MYRRSPESKKPATTLAAVTCLSFAPAALSHGQALVAPEGVTCLPADPDTEAFAANGRNGNRRRSDPSIARSPRHEHQPFEQMFGILDRQILPSEKPGERVWHGLRRVVRMRKRRAHGIFALDGQ